MEEDAKVHCLGERKNDAAQNEIGVRGKERERGVEEKGE